MTTLYVAGRGDATDPIGGLFRYDRDGESWSGQRLDAITQLSSLAPHPQWPVLYGTSGVGSGGRFHAWRLDPDGGVTTLADTTSGGAEPCHLCVLPSGRHVVVANYTTGTLACWDLDGAGVPIADPTMTPLPGAGAGVEPARQDAPHPHQILVSADRLLVPDLGSDLVRLFEWDDDGVGDQVGAHPVPPGTGPRHAAVAADGTVAVSGELAQSVVFPFASAATVLPSTHVTGEARSRPPRNYPGDLKISGGYGYLANRGYDTIGVFSLVEQPQLIAEVDSGVRWPQHLLIDDSTLYVAGWDSSQVMALPLGADGVPGPPTLCFECPGAAWLIGLPS